jgi:D-alanyl-D-alanine dipeptidase
MRIVQVLLILGLTIVTSSVSWFSNQQQPDQEGWTNVRTLEPDIVLDIRYASTNNFMGEKVYACGECYLRKEVAQAIAQVHRKLKAKGYGGLKMYDCYRPHSAQWKLWKKVPNPQYVADPRKGSMHNRGAAVDLTVIDKNGKELDMGTGYDVFDKKAYIDYTGHPAAINNNRKLLQEAMIGHGFRTTRTEWWHFSFTKQAYGISDFQWKCK